MPYVALTIAGSDPSGGAGIQADLKSFHQRGVYGTSVITLVTVQNTLRVDEVQVLSPELVGRQLDVVLEDIHPNAAKTGALGNSAVVQAIAERAGSFSFPLVVDPVMISKHGSCLMSEESRRAVAENLLPHAFLVTPNLHEAEVLSGLKVEDLSTMEKAARRIAALGSEAVLVKGGHLDSRTSVDVLLWKDAVCHFKAERVDTRHTHGTGCTFSAVITAELAKGRDLLDAVGTAKRFITEAIKSNPGLGKGAGPVNHHVRIDE
jgi:hydroxymethylpyrimidine/phosphomethylpyrimidine kinase